MLACSGNPVAKIVVQNGEPCTMLLLRFMGVVPVFAMLAVAARLQ